MLVDTVALDGHQFKPQQIYDDNVLPSGMLTSIKNRVNTGALKLVGTNPEAYALGKWKAIFVYWVKKHKSTRPTFVPYDDSVAMRDAELAKVKAELASLKKKETKSKK